MEANGRKITAIVADGFEQKELDGPVKALRDAGYVVEILAQYDAHRAHIHGVNQFDEGPGAKADAVIDPAKPEDYAGILVPGGAASPDTMRQSPKHVAFVKAFMDAKKPMEVICHGPWLLADADVVKGRTVTSWPGIRRDLERAGAKWVDREVVVDGNLVTRESPTTSPSSRARSSRCSGARGARARQHADAAEGRLMARQECRGHPLRTPG